MRRKKNKNQKIDIYRILMLPLMTMFLLNIGLVATTWAWYTASVSSGVNEIKADVDVTVSVKNGEQVIQETNGKYVLPSGDNTIQLTGGSATSGYIVLMDIGDESTSTSSSILNLFFTPAYAETINTKYYVEISKETSMSLTISTPSESTQNKILSIQKLWCEKEGESIKPSLIYGYTKADGAIDLNPVKTSYTINLLNEEETPLKQSEVMNEATTYSQNTEEDLDAVITVEDTDETEITMPSFDGYELISVNGEDPKESYILTEGQENVFNAVYKKIEATEKEESITDNEQEKIVVSDTEAVESENAVVEIPAQNEPPVESTTPISGSGSTMTQISSESILETPGEQETVNTEPVQPATVSQEETQNELSEQETVIDDVPVAQSEETAIEENMEVVDNAQSESGD